MLKIFNNISMIFRKINFQEWSRTLFLLACLSVSLFVQAQDQLLEQYVSIVTDFEQRSPIAYQSTYHYYENLEDKEAQHKLEIAVRKTEQAMYYAYEQIEVYQTKNKMLYIDHIDKSIIIHSSDQAVNPNNQLGAYARFIEALQLKGQQDIQENGQTLLHFDNPKLSKTELSIYYNTDNKLLQQATVAFDFLDQESAYQEYDQTKLSVQFTDYQLDNIQIPIVLSDVYKKVGSDIVGLGKFKAYKINQL